MAVTFGIMVTKTICKVSFHIISWKNENNIAALEMIVIQYVFI
jgi:hypothetical protein